MLYSELLKELKHLCNEFEGMYPVTEGTYKEFDALFNRLDDTRIDIERYVKHETERSETAYIDGAKVGYNRYFTTKEINDLKNLNE